MDLTDLIKSTLTTNIRQNLLVLEKEEQKSKEKEEMVNIEEVSQQEEQQEELASTTRQLDAECLEELLGQVSRESAKLHLANLIAKLKKESLTLKRVEASKAKVSAPSSSSSTSKEVNDDAKSPAPAPVQVKSEPAKMPAPSAETRYVPISSFAFDAGGYNGKFVTLYVSLVGVGSLDRSNITCEFTKDSFDLIVKDYQGKTLRLMRDNLEHDIVNEKSKIIVKADKIVIKLAKVKGEYSYDSWTNLTDKKGKKKKAEEKSKDPSASIMELMKDMYDSGDDKMKKMIGETMLKQREGKLGGGPDGMPDMPPM